MRLIATRSVIRLLAVVFAVACGWVASATEQKAHPELCRNPFYGTNPASPAAHISPLVSCSYTMNREDLASGRVWLLGPTIGMGIAILVAFVFALVAISPRQGSLLAYRWRRAVY